MAERTVSVTLKAKVDAFKADMAAAGKSASDAAQKTETAWDKSNTGMGKAMQKVNQYSSEMTTAGTAMATFGGVVVGALGLSAKAAMSWESAFAGVLKTVDGTPRQLAKVEEGLRGLTKVLPASHEEIAAVAEAAGQLGVKTGNVVSFTKTMINMGESTNMSAEEAATGLARLSNIMGTSQNDFGKMGASIVGLGNNFATTEREILEMSGRIAGVGKQAGLTEGDVFGLATALSSVGIDAEAGGTAISMVMKKIGNEVSGGGDKVAEFARIAGMSSADFSAAWNDDAGGALDMFVKGLGRAQASGENVNGTLTTLGVTGIRESDALLRLSGAGDVLTNALKMGNDEYERGTALAQEAAKRYETAESKIAMAGNSLKDTAITIGETFLPAIATGAEAFASFADGIGKIPEPVLKLGAVLGGIAGAAALAGGAALILVPKIAETMTAFSTLKAAVGDSSSALGKFSGSKAGGALRGIGKAAGFATGAWVGLQLAAAAYNSTSTKPAVQGIEDITNAIIKTSQESGTASIELDKLFQGKGGGELAGNVRDLDSAIESVMYKGDPFNKFVNESLGGDAINNALGTTNKAKEQFYELDEAMSNLASSGSGEMAAETFSKVAAAFEAQGYSAQDAVEFFPEYEAALQGVANEAGVALDKQELLAWMMSGEMPPALAAVAGASDLTAEAVAGVGGAADDAAGGLQSMLDGLTALGLATLSEREAIRSYEDALDEVNESIKENGRSLDVTTEKGRANQEAFDAIARAGLSAADSMVKNGADQKTVQNQLETTYDDLIKAAGQFGITGKKAEDMAKEVMGIPKDVDVKTWMSNAAEEQAKKTKKAVDDIDKDVKIKVSFNVTEPKNGIKNMPENLLNPNRNRSKQPGSLNQWGPKADGGIDLMPMAAGGVHSNIAEMVPPNTWRVVGDRMDVDEAFIPLDGSRRSKDILMEAIKRMPGLGMAKGGIASADASVGAAEDRLRSARRAKSDAKTKAAKSTADRRIRVAEDDLQAAKKSLKAAKDKQKADETAAKIAADRAKEERERRARVGELRSDFRTDVRRGSLRDQVTGGLSGGYSAVDQLAGLGGNKDLSRGSRSKASSSARKFEANLKALYSQAERIDDRLKKAQDKATELKGIKDSVTSSLLGGRELDVGTFQTQQNGQWSSHSNLGQAAKGLKVDVGAMKAFAGKLKKLTELGVPGSIIQEIAQAGVSEGSNMADSFIDATSAERKSYMGAWSDYEKYANQAGQYVTEGFQAGGASAADGVVKGLEGKKKSVESAIANLAKAMESTFKQVLGIHSPSRVMSELGGFTAEGLVQGMLGGAAGVQSAADVLAQSAMPNMMGFAPSDVAFDVTASPVVEDDEGMAGLAMQDMSTTTLEAMALMQQGVSDGWAAMLFNTQEMQAGLLLGTQANNAAMSLNTSETMAAMLLNLQTQQSAMLLDMQTKQASMLLGTQTQYEAMRLTTEQKQIAQKTVMTDQQELMRLMLIDKQASMLLRSSTDFESMKDTAGTKFSDMRKNTDGTMSGMYTDYSTRLGDLKGLNKRGFESILATSNANMKGVRDGIDGQMAAAKPELGNRLNSLINVLSSFTASVNKAFGDVGVKLTAPKSLKFATGGVLPGYTPGRDVHDFYSPTGGHLGLSGGEAIMRPEFTKAVGGKAGVDRLNREAMNGRMDYHSDRFANGGVIPSFNFAQGGTLIDAANWWVRKGAKGSRHPAFGGAVRSGHSRNSLHYQDKAVDLNFAAGTSSYEQGQFDKYLPDFKSSFPGIRVLWKVPNHWNHMHIDTGNGAAVGSGAGLNGGGMSHPFLDRAKVSPGSDMSKAYAKAAKKLTSQIYAKHAKELPDGIGGQLGRGIMADASEGLIDKAKDYGKTTAVSGTSAGDPAVKAAVRKLAEQYGWSDQWGDIDWLVNKESGWNPKAANPSSSARGLFQKMTSIHGPVEDTVEGQARWGFDYIKNRYNDPRGARSFWERNNWYESGTESAKSGWAVVGEDGPELVNLSGGEQIKNGQETRKLLAENRTFIPNQRSGFDTSALSDAMSAAIQSNGINANDLASALNGVKLTFQADGQQFTGAVTAVVGNGYDESRSRLAKSSQKIGAR